MNTLITGASGFVGTHLVKYFRENDPGFTLFRLARGNSPASQTDFEATVTWDQLSPKWLIENRIQVVIHLAGLAHAEAGVFSEDDYNRVNYELTKTLFDAFSKSRTGEKFIFMSTVKAVRDQLGEEVLTETTKPEPTTPYGVAKLKAEQYISSNKRSGKEVYILRPCMVYGPGNKGNMDLLVSLLSKNIPYPLGAFHNLRSFLFIENLCFVVYQLLTGNIPSETFNVSDPEPISTKELVNLLKKNTASKSPFWSISPWLIKCLATLGDVLPIPLNSSRLEKLTESYAVDSSKLTDAIGEKLPFTTAQGLEKTFHA